MQTPKGVNVHEFALMTSASWHCCSVELKVCTTPGPYTPDVKGDVGKERQASDVEVVNEVAKQPVSRRKGVETRAPLHELALAVCAANVLTETVLPAASQVCIWDTPAMLVHAPCFIPLIIPFVEPVQLVPVNVLISMYLYLSPGACTGGLQRGGDGGLTGAFTFVFAFAIVGFGFDFVGAVGTLLTLVGTLLQELEPLTIPTRHTKAINC